MEKQYYSAIHHSREVWQKSSSGGAFTALTDAWFSAHGDHAAVYGCILDEKLKAKHVRAGRPEERDAMRGSKYIASDLTGVYAQVEQDLLRENFVLFSGTPCQIAALHGCLRVKHIDAKRLLTVEVICHGVGSSGFFEDYIAHLEQKYKSKAVSCSFRGKSRPDKIQEMSVTFQNGRRYISPAARFDWFYTAYLKNYILRPSCYSCRFANQTRTADISIADHWQAQGGPARSLVIANSPEGDRWISRLGDAMTLTRLQGAEVYVPNMHHASKKPEDYDDFWRAYQASGYLGAQTWLGNNGAGKKCKAALAAVLYWLHLSELLKKMKKMGRRGV